MRDELVGYLLDALEPDERAAVEQKLAENPELQGELALLSRALEPLECGSEHYAPGPRLAERTCEFVVHQAMIVSLAGGEAPPVEVPVIRSRRWSLADLAVAVGIFIAGSAVLFPAINQSRYSARLTSCQDNLRRIGVGLAEYSGLHQGLLPEVPAEGNMGAAGIYAARLADSQLLSDPRTLICPDSDLANHAGGFRVPTLDELQRAHGEELARLQQSMGGSYGYNLGYVFHGQIQPPRNLQRPHFALMADAPRPESLPGAADQPDAAAEPRSMNHGGRGHNVLFEDGHVDFLTGSRAGGLDNIFLNDEGHVAVGLHQDDAVIAGSGAHPVAPAPSR